MSVEDRAPRLRWTTLLAGLKAILAVLLPSAALLAPVLTGVYYLSLAAGSGAAARQMMALSDPVSTALSLTVAFLPALAAVLATGAVIASRGRFPLFSVALAVFFATILSGLNIDQRLFLALGFVSALSVVAALAVPSEYPAEMLRLFGSKGARPAFRGRWAAFVHRHRVLDRSAVVLAFASWVVCAATTVALFVGLTLTQLFNPQVYEIRFSDGGTPTQVVWFSTSEEGTWYLTLHSDRPNGKDAPLGIRDLEWSPQTPTSIITCGLSASPCNLGVAETPDH